jgi:hypothetical protein
MNFRYEEWITSSEKLQIAPMFASHSGRCPQSHRIAYQLGLRFP